MICRIKLDYEKMLFKSMHLVFINEKHVSDGKSRGVSVSDTSACILVSSETTGFRAPQGGNLRESGNLEMMV